MESKMRVLIVARILERGEPVTSRQILDELSAKWDITADRKTICSDIAAINRIMPVLSTTGYGGGYRLWDVFAEAE